MKILILANNDGGLYKFRKELIAELTKEHEVVALVPYGECISAIESLGCKCISTNISRHGTNPLKDFILFRTYYHLIKNEKSDIVLTYTIKPNIYGGIACSMLNIPYIVNITGLGSAVENEGFLQKITLCLYRIALKKAKKVFFQNASNQKFMLDKKVICGNYDLLPGSGVNLEEYSVTEYPKQDVIQFSFVARIMREKGIDEYLDAARYIHKKYPQTCFNIYGFCEEKYEKILGNLHEKGIIKYHGSVSNMKQVYDNTSCTIHPTFYPEGLSNVLLESCACGRPIITTNRPGCAEVIDDGVNGFLIKEKDSKDLIEKIERFLQLSFDERKQMGLAGRRKVESQFNRQIVIDKYLAEIHSI